MALFGKAFERNIEEKIIQQGNPATRGEEGLLYRISEGNTNYWAKKWYKPHNTGIMMNLEANGSPASPYWHEVISDLYQVINDAFPLSTANIRAAYDPRISENIQGDPEFWFINGRPTTVTQEPPYDPEKLSKRDQIADNFYKKIFQYKEPLFKQGKGTTLDDPYIREVRLEVDQALKKILGEDLHLGYNEQPDSIIKKLKIKNRHNLLIEMLEAGIYPIHPEVNFIPATKETHPRPPHGTFIELDIYDLDKLKQFMAKKYANQPAELQKINKMINDYVLCQSLDEIFRIILYPKVSPFGAMGELKRKIVFEKEFQSAFYRLLEKFRLRHQEGKYNLLDEQTKQWIYYRLNSILQTSFSASHAAEQIDTAFTACI